MIAFGLVLAFVVIISSPCELYRCRCQDRIGQNAETTESGCGYHFKRLYRNIIPTYKHWFGDRSKLIHGLATVFVLS